MNRLTKATLIAFTTISISYASSMLECGEAGANISKQNYQTAIEACKPFAVNNPKAAGILGSAYYFAGKYTLAEKYSLKFINAYKNSNNPEIQKELRADYYIGLGNLYYFGKIPNKVQKGLQYITQGAELGNATAQFQLGVAYFNGKNLPKNIPLAYQWFTISKAMGNADASNNFIYKHEAEYKEKLPYCIALGQDNVGQAYYEGIGGLQQSTATALDWLEKAASTDPNVSQVNLDLAKLYYLNGDKDKAFTVAQKAATQPLAQAMQYLGTLYQKGVWYRDKNPVKAYAYLSLAVELYNNPATQFWQKYAAPCRPNYEGRTKEFNVKVATEQLSEIDLSAKQKQQADKLIKQVKEQFKL